MNSERSLKALSRLIGTWNTEATHPSMPGTLVHGTVKIEWLEGEQFLIHRARTDHPDFPDSVSIIGITERDRVEDQSSQQGAPQLHMHYYDSRGVFRNYSASIDDAVWRLEMLSPGFSQRFTGTFADDGNTIVGLWQMCQDEQHWNDDLRITYRRSTSPA
jgi:hypothetical protein